MTSNNLEIDHDKVKGLRYAYEALEFSLDSVIHQATTRVIKRLSIT